MRAERYRTKERAEVEIFGRGGEVTAKIKDLSQTGACLQWEEEPSPMQIGDLLRLRVFLRALQREHRLNAEVIWSNGNLSGVQFLTSDQLVQKMLFRGAE